MGDQTKFRVCQDKTAEANIHQISPTSPSDDRTPKPHTYKCAIDDSNDGVTEAVEEDIHHNGTNLTAGDKALKPDTDESVTDPIETTNSKEEITQKTRMAGEIVVVVTDGPGVE